MFYTNFIIILLELGMFGTLQTQETAAVAEDLEHLSAENRLHIRWFQGKCLLDRSWC